LLDRATGYAAGRDLQKVGRDFDVYNTTSWPRSELVVLRGVESPLDHFTDANGKAVPSQRFSADELAIWVSEIPPFGSARFHGSTNPPEPPNEGVAIYESHILDNELIRVVVDPQTGGISELYRRGSGENLVDTRNGGRVNQFLYLPGSDLAELQSNGAASITIDEAGPLVATLRIESDAPTCKSLVRKVRLDYVELTNIVDKKRAPMNPNPGKGGPGDDWAQHGGKESIQFAFPFDMRQGQIRVNIPFAVMRPEIDQLPGACKNWMPVGRWIDVANDKYGVTWATLDAPLVEIGEISARLLGSQRNPAVWRKRIEPTQTFYSWVMNNHWGTNYRAYQEGVVTFRYALRPHMGYDAAAAARFATALSQPLVVSPATASTDSKPPLLLVEPSDVLVTALKPSDDGKACIVRLFGASGEDRQAKLTWPAGQVKDVWLSDLSEGPVGPAGNLVTVRGWDLYRRKSAGRMGIPREEKRSYLPDILHPHESEIPTRAALSVISYLQGIEQDAIHDRKEGGVRADSQPQR
jgi:alpha-mannosidase